MWQEYQWIRFIHIAAGFTFMMAHGASVALSFRLKREYEVDFFKKEHHLERIQAYLDLAGETWMTSMVSLVVLVTTGVINGFLGNWWDRALWMWASIGILILMVLWMRTPTREIHDLRKAVGMPYREHGDVHPPDEPLPFDEIERMLKTTHPWVSTAVGYGGTLVILYLMAFKPF